MAETFDFRRLHRDSRGRVAHRSDRWATQPRIPPTYPEPSAWGTQIIKGALA